MGTILDKIVTRTLQTVAESKARTPEADLERRIGRAAPRAISVPRSTGPEACRCWPR